MPRVVGSASMRALMMVVAGGSVHPGVELAGQISFLVKTRFLSA